MNVTLPRCCEGCGGSLEGRRPHARTCGPACRKRIERGARKCDTAWPKPEPNGGAASWAVLRRETGLTDRELRRVLVRLQADVDGAARERIGRLSITEADRRLFADDDDRGQVAA